MTKEGSNLSILLVDDEPISLRGYEFNLRSEGINNLVLCEDGREALEIIKNKDFDIYILDLIMPHIPGDVLASQILNKHADAVIIIITGLEEEEVLMDDLKTKAFDVIQKPVDDKKLLAVINKAIKNMNV